MGVWLRKSSHRFHGFAQMAWLRLFSHGIHRIHRSFVALIRPRNSQNSQKLGCVSPPTDFTDLHRWLGYVCSPTDFTEFTEVRLHKSSHRFHGFAQMAWSRLFSHGIHGIHRSFVASVLPRNSQNSQNLLLRRASHGFHRFTQILRVRFVPTEFTESTEFGSVGMAGMPYPPTSVNIRVICGRLFSARSFCEFRAFCGSPFSARGSVYSVHSVGASSPLVRLVQQRLLHPLAESTEVVCTSHHLTISPQQHHFTSNPAFCMSSQYCGYDFVTTCGSLMRSPGNTMAAGANAIAMRWSS